VFFAIPTVPHVLLVKVLRFVEFLEAVLKGDVFLFVGSDLIGLFFLRNECLAGVVALKAFDGEMLAP
jgi:hypothetical protein